MSNKKVNRTCFLQPGVRESGSSQRYKSVATACERELLPATVELASQYG